MKNPSLVSRMPKLHKVPVFGIDDNTVDFQFEWPRQGDLDPGLLNGARVTRIKWLADDKSFRGFQLKLSNGVCSPIFAQAWNNH